MVTMDRFNVRKVIFRGGVLLFIFTLLIAPNLYIPVEYRAIFNNVFLIDYVGREKFLLHEGYYPLWEKGYTETIKIDPAYSSSYGVAFKFPCQEDLGFGYEQYYNGVLQVDLYRNGKMLESKTIHPGKYETYELPKHVIFYCNSFFAL